MKRVLVGTRHGQPAIHWPAVFGLGVVVGIVGGGAAAGTWFLLTRELSLATILLAVPLAVGWLAGTAIRDRWSIPPDQLSQLD